MEALALTPTFDYTADWSSPQPGNLRRSAVLSVPAALDPILEDIARAALSQDALEIFEMQILEYSSRQALARCFTGEGLEAY